jgi:hypothetical protein
LDERTPSAGLDLRELLATLHRHGVGCTVVGGVAVQVHGHRRTTKDLDVIADPARANRERLAARSPSWARGRATCPAARRRRTISRRRRS